MKDYGLFSLKDNIDNKDNFRRRRSRAGSFYISIRMKRTEKRIDTLDIVDIAQYTQPIVGYIMIIAALSLMNAYQFAHSLQLHNNLWHSKQGLLCIGATNFGHKRER